MTDDLKRERDERVKEYMKELADARNHEKHSDIESADKVLIKQEKKDKLDTPNKPVPYTMESTKGSIVTLKRGDHKSDTQQIVSKNDASRLWCGKC